MLIETTHILRKILAIDKTKFKFLKSSFNLNFILLLSKFTYTETRVFWCDNDKYQYSSNFHSILKMTLTGSAQKAYELDYIFITKSFLYIT